MALLEEQGALPPEGRGGRLSALRPPAPSGDRPALATPAQAPPPGRAGRRQNPQEDQELTDFIHKIRDEYDLSILMIEHHMDLVMRISDRIYVLTDPAS